MDEYSLQQAVAAENARLTQDGIGTRFSAQPLGPGCRDCFWVQHSDSSGALITSTQVTFIIADPIVRNLAFHPRISLGHR
jgi:hypothetical protein